MFSSGFEIKQCWAEDCGKNSKLMETLVSSLHAEVSWSVNVCTSCLLEPR